MAKKKKDTKPSSKKSDKPKKKRRVGRPKKRGRPKKSYAKKKKKREQQAKVTKSKQRSKSKAGNQGFASNTDYNRVRKVLWEKFKFEYDSYLDFIRNEVDSNGNPIKGSNIVSRVYEECKDLQCTDNDIIRIYETVQEQAKDDGTPVLPQYLFSHFDNFYWHLTLETRMWEGFDERVWVKSPMLLKDPDFFLGIHGSDRRVRQKDGTYKLIKGKWIRFRSVVNYLNRLLKHMKYDSGRAPCFKFGSYDEDGDFRPVVQWNDDLKRWEVELVLTDADGNINDFGYDPETEGKTQPIPDEIIEEVTTEEEPEEAPEEQVEEEPEEEKEDAETIKARTEEIRTQTKARMIEVITKRFEDGKITLDEYLSAIERIDKLKL